MSAPDLLPLSFRWHLAIFPLAHASSTEYWLRNLLCRIGTLDLWFSGGLKRPSLLAQGLLGRSNFSFYSSSALKLISRFTRVILEELITAVPNSGCTPSSSEEVCWRIVFLGSPTLILCDCLDLTFLLSSDKWLVNGVSCSICFDEGYDCRGMEIGMDKWCVIKFSLINFLIIN